MCCCTSLPSKDIIKKTDLTFFLELRIAMYVLYKLTLHKHIKAPFVWLFLPPSTKCRANLLMNKTSIRKKKNLLFIFMILPAPLLKCKQSFQLFLLQRLLDNIEMHVLSYFLNQINRRNEENQDFQFLTP